MDFLGQDYKKRVFRGKSNCFECIDQLDVVVQVITTLKLKNYFLFMSHILIRFQSVEVQRIRKLLIVRT